VREQNKTKTDPPGTDMNKANLKSYAPKARLDFIKAVTERANVLGISAAGVVPAEVRGDVALIDGREWPAKVAGQRDELIARIQRHGFEQTMDEVAYTWFNRFAALRYMEIHDYLGHGWRVLSSRDGGLPEILRHASEVTLPGLSPDRSREMQLAGNQDNELYKLLLVAQCNELSRVMPFLFERIDDETELLLPENLLRTDSIVAKLLEQVPEEDWQEIEVIGWLYQFYISERKEEVTGKVVQSEDIPAATQLFTPNWIVQYMVQNSVGRLWLKANPVSTLASQWPYYIQPAKQMPEVEAQLDALLEARIREDGETLNPETITVLDPACGSGHILVVAYDVLKDIYLERGYQPRSIPRLILEKNLYGLDIDDRAGQLAAFALLMKARADDRRLFSEPPKLNVLSLQDSTGLNLEDLCANLSTYGIPRGALRTLLETFQHAKSFGSLIQIPSSLATQLPGLVDALEVALINGDLYEQRAARDVMPLIQQGLVLALQYDVIAENPPYMGSQYFTTLIKSYLAETLPGCDKDLFAAFIARAPIFGKPSSIIGIVTSFTWMFISSFEKLRKGLLQERNLESLVQLEYDAFEDAKAHLCTFTFGATHVPNYKATFIRLTDFPGAENQGPRTLDAIRDRACGWLFETEADDFWKIPGNPIAYWLDSAAFEAFETQKRVADFGKARIGMATGKNALYVRYWHEVSWSKVGIGFNRDDASKSSKKWFPYAKGGGFRRWYGNVDVVVNWQDDGALLRNTMHPDGKRFWAHNFNLNEIFKPAICWNVIASTENSFRYHDAGFLFDSAAGLLQTNDRSESFQLLGLLNSRVSSYFLPAINPTINLPPGYLEQVPVVLAGDNEVVLELIDLSRNDWANAETSWSFRRSPLCERSTKTTLLADSWSQWQVYSDELRNRALKLETENNRRFISAYGLSHVLGHASTEDEITLARADREKDCLRLISYMIGCMMGRYSLVDPGLIQADAGNSDLDPDRYGSKFPPDADGIVVATGDPWFEGDAAGRVPEFLRAVWGAENLAVNMSWLAESLGIRGGESPDEAIRRYLADKFYKDHLQTYKKRPIYWLFSSGKQGAFQALVYLHRYNEGTLARMRAEYVVPLIAKMSSRLEMLDKDVAAAASAGARTKLQKQVESLRKNQIELVAYDEKLRHYADMRITLDLDDGVKVNYAKFGDLVADSKVITGGSDE